MAKFGLDNLAFLGHAVSSESEQSGVSVVGDGLYVYGYYSAKYPDNVAASWTSPPSGYFIPTENVLEAADDLTDRLPAGCHYYGGTDESSGPLINYFPQTVIKPATEGHLCSDDRAYIECSHDLHDYDFNKPSNELAGSTAG